MNIINLHNNSSPKDCYYILDSNVWLPILGIDDEPTSQHYKIFFDKIFKLEHAKIVLCSLQLSEILNRLLRFHARKLYDLKYKSRSGSPKFTEFYKSEYRCSEQFKLQYESIIDDIEGYFSHIFFKDLTDAEFSVITSFDSKKSDFNDHYLYLLAKQESAIIITHDADFFGLDIEVGTYNFKLYKSYTDSIKPKN